MARMFLSLATRSARWGKGWVDTWAPQDGRFSPTPAANGEPEGRRWKMIYWIGIASGDVDGIVALLDALHAGYEVWYDLFELEFVVLTDFGTSEDTED